MGVIKLSAKVFLKLNCFNFVTKYNWLTLYGKLQIILTIQYVAYILTY